MRKPIPGDFGLTSQQYTEMVAERTQLLKALEGQIDLYSLIQELFGRFVLALVSLFLVIMFLGAIGCVAGAVLAEVVEKVLGPNQLSSAPPYIGGIGGCIFGIIIWMRELYREGKQICGNFRSLRQYRRLLSHPRYSKVQLYEGALSRWVQTQQEYWRSLRGVEFERAMARLYRDIGYKVHQTKASGDEGVDLVLEKEGTKTVVQWKGHANPIGVRAVRDLYGTMMYFGADNAILACPAGFTKGVQEFVVDKPMRLISAEELAKMAESAREEQKDQGSPTGLPIGRDHAPP